jgi:hypothetical protein
VFIVENLREFRFRGCKNLEFDKKEYPSCRRVPVPGYPTYLCWERPEHPHPRLCQYCKIGRRRINKYFSCLDQHSSNGHTKCTKCTKCTKYAEIEHVISVPVSEIEPPLSYRDKQMIKRYLFDKIKNYDPILIKDVLRIKGDVIKDIKDFLLSLKPSDFYGV